MKLQDWFRIISRPRGRLWVAPTVGALAAVVLAGVTLGVDTVVEWRDLPVPVFKGEADTARSVLGAIATAAATLIALIFNVIAVVIQLSSQQYSPRALSLLVQDRPSYWTIGVFVATFTYALTVMLSLRLTIAEEDREALASLAVTVAFVMAVVSLGAFAAYSNHIIHTTRVSSIVKLISDKTRLTIAQYYTEPYVDAPEAATPSGPADVVIDSPREGAFSDWNDRDLSEAAARYECTIVVLPTLGAFVPADAPLLELRGGRPPGVEQHVSITSQRTFERDVAYGMRLLVDVATRGLATGANDATTAVQAIDQLHDLLRRLVTRALPRVHVLKVEGQPRVWLHMSTWEDLLHLAVDEIRQDGSDSLQVVRRLRSMLDDLAGVAPASRRPSIEHQLELLDTAVAESFTDERVRQFARQPDARGLGF
ncbi:DUF2254 domain-containing protein [Phycisphaerales bacterium AB-hyl4]|uniref:DUF2254 domain-containing protein n=1 Tax=Natronomicrosphaera hydrolytica TaxID=3242702 RepID=A0ABV4U6U3_9BACT